MAIAIEVRPGPVAMFQIGRPVVRGEAFVSLQILPQYIITDLHLEEELLQVVEAGRPALFQELKPGLVSI